MGLAGVGSTTPSSANFASTFAMKCSFCLVWPCFAQPLCNPVIADRERTFKPGTSLAAVAAVRLQPYVRAQFRGQETHSNEIAGQIRRRHRPGRRGGAGFRRAADPRAAD